MFTPGKMYYVLKHKNQDAVPTNRTYYMCVSSNEVSSVFYCFYAKQKYIVNRSYYNDYRSEIQDPQNHFLYKKRIKNNCYHYPFMDYKPYLIDLDCTLLAYHAKNVDYLVLDTDSDVKNYKKRKESSMKVIPLNQLANLLFPTEPIKEPSLCL